MTADEPSPQAPPREIRVSTKRDRLTLVWADGREDVLEAVVLRQNCQSAKAKHLRLMGTALPPAVDVRIAAVNPVGSYAINIAFSDGHDRGIYPWSFLAELTADTKAIT
ncbi:gamma-butyrobetaine hydroxylase-like domain-containing protein [Chelativorans alearense]|uniref:gamma-butyrobetaine hydroxylase-like domain-containing protein n=1 Tax=Chelativorans alearense TaxID=2681495 RepID=UPI0013D15A91|nr:DUF971 domain-containing protein [Chelativorans alearense]